jgi:hypothetical protein
VSSRRAKNANTLAASRIGPFFSVSDNKPPAIANPRNDRNSRRWPNWVTPITSSAAPHSIPELVTVATTANSQMIPEINIANQQIHVGPSKYLSSAKRRWSRPKTGIMYKRWKASRLNKRDDV